MLKPVMHLQASSPDIQNPYPGFHAARVREPGDFEEGTFRTKEIDTGITIIVGKLKGQDTMTTQTYRFDKNKFSVSEAKAWLKDHDVKIISFEPASEDDKLQNNINSQLSDSEAEILMYGDVGDEINGDEIAQRISDLNAQGVKVIHERINSGGGQVINGLSIVAANLNSDAKIITYNDGVAASMAGIILMSGDEIHMRDYARLMIHEPSIGSETIETTEDEKTKTALIAIRDMLSKIIQKRCKKSKTEVDEIMNKETWLNANKAKKEGYVDKIITTKLNSENRRLTASVENKSKDGSVWEITLINTGMANTLSGKVFLSKDVLLDAMPLFNKIDVMAHQFGMLPDGRLDLRHRPANVKKNQFFMNNTGLVDNIRTEDENGMTLLKGDYHVVNPVVKAMLVNIWNTDREKMPQFSVDADIDSELIGETSHIKKFIKVNSLDMVTQGAFPEAGIDRMVASTKFNITEEKMNELIKMLLAKVKEGKMKLADSIDNKSDEEITTMIETLLEPANDKIEITAEMLKELSNADKIEDVKAEIKKLADSLAAKPDPVPAAKPEPDKDLQNQIAEQAKEIQAMKMKASIADMEVLLSREATLDASSKDMIRQKFSGRIASEADVTNEIKAMKQFVDKLIAAKGGSVLVAGKNDTSKKAKLMEIFMEPTLLGTEGYEFSYGETYRNLPDMISDFASAPRFDGVKTMQAAVSTSDFTILFQDVMNKQIRKQYEAKKVDDMMKKLINEVPLDNLGEQHIYDVGGFGTIDDVTENSDYTELDTPDDMEATYTPKKIGNTFTITEEMLYEAGDKVTQLIRTFPMNMATSAKVTLWKYVFGLITNCSGSTANSGTIYDSTALYTSAHGNLATDALGYSSFFAGYTAMSNQTKLSTTYPVEIEPAFLLVPTELHPTAVNVCKNPVYPSQTSNGVAINNPYAGYGVEPIKVPKYYLCNDSNKWYLIANKNGFPTLQLGYFQNQRVPKMFLQNDPTQGDTFLADKWKWKVKWRFGGCVTDYRGFYSGQYTG